MKKIKILKVIPSRVEKNWTWISNFLNADEYQFTFYGLNAEKSLHRIIAGINIKENLLEYDIVITTEYYTTFAINLKLKLLGAKADHIKHIAYGFNRSRRALKSGIGFIDRFIDAVFARSDMVLTFSRFEQSLFVKEHNLNPEKFFSTHWAYALPEISATEFSSRRRPYVCMIGRNNRDFRSFVDAVKDMDLDGVIIAPSYKASEIDVSKIDNISLYHDLDMNTCCDCIKNSFANIILVNDETVGAGHITMVISMLLGKVQIISDVEPINDYFINKIHGLTVPLNDATSVSSALQFLINNPDLKELYENAAKEYAEKWFSPEREAELLKENLDRLISGQKLEQFSKNWQAEYDKLCDNR